MENEFKSIMIDVINFSKYVKPIMDGFRNWYIENKVIIQSIIEAGYELSNWARAIDLMKNNQFVFTDDLTLEFAIEVIDSSDVNETVEKYYFGNNEMRMTNLIERIMNYKQMKDYKELFSQVVFSYNSNHYLLASLGAFTIIDGIMSLLSEDITSTNFRKRMNLIKEKLNKNVELSQMDKLLFCIISCIDTVSSSFFDRYDFDNIEKDTIDRNWITHGRTKRIYTKCDFLKIILFLDAIIILDNYKTALCEV